MQFVIHVTTKLLVQLVFSMVLKFASVHVPTRIFSLGITRHNYFSE